MDRELLEWAAKAAGFGVTPKGKHEVCWTKSEHPKGSGKSGALWNYIGHMDAAELWNPLTDDGDALRLAVKLNIDLYMPCDEAYVRAVGRADIFIDEKIGTDRFAATRLAITRAAAEIGKSIGGVHDGIGS